MQIIIGFGTLFTTVWNSIFLLPFPGTFFGRSVCSVAFNWGSQLVALPITIPMNKSFVGSAVYESVSAVVHMFPWTLWKTPFEGRDLCTDLSDLANSLAIDKTWHNVPRTGNLRINCALFVHSQSLHSLLQSASAPLPVLMLMLRNIFSPSASVQVFFVRPHLQTVGSVHPLSMHLFSHCTASFKSPRGRSNDERAANKPLPARLLTKSEIPNIHPSTIFPHWPWGWC